MRGLIALILLLLSVPSSLAQVSGRVYDAESGAPLPGATVTSPDSGSAGTTTDGSGRFQLSVPEGAAVVTARFVGYAPSSKTIVVESGAALLDFYLEPMAWTLDEVLVEQASMTGGLIGIQDMMGSAHVVTARGLDKFATSDIHRALRAVPGVSIQEEDGYGLRPNIGLRGSGSERSSKITLMEDGVLIAPAPYAAPSAYYFPTTGRMSGIEVVKGSSQIAYGPLTTGGAINLLSAPVPDGRQGNVTLLAGDDANRLLHARVGDSGARLGYLLETHQQQTDGFKKLDAGGSTGFDKQDYLGKVRLVSRNEARFRQSLLLKLSYTDETSDETYLGLTGNDFGQTPLRRYAGSQADRMQADHRQGMVRHRIWPTANLEVITTAYATRFHRNWYKLDKVKTAGGSVGIASVLDAPQSYPEAYAALTGNSPSSVLSVKANNRTYHARGVQMDAHLAMGDNRLDLGGRVHYDDMDRFQWADDYRLDGAAMTLLAAGEPGSDSNRIESAHAASAYAQMRFHLGRLSVRPGVRMEHVIQRRLDYGKADPERIGDQTARRRNSSLAFMPGLGASLSIQPHWSVFAGVHKGFAPPGTTEGTKPESSLNYEAGTRILRGPARLEAVTFLTDYSNLLGSDLAASGGTGSTDQFNGGEALVRGLELSASYNLGELARWKASVPVAITYTFTAAEFSSSFESEFEPWGSVSKGDELPYQAGNQFTGSLAIERSRWEVSLSASWVGRMRTNAGAGSPSADERINAHAVVDLSMEVEMTRSVRAFAVVRNLTDEVYVAARRPAGLRPGLPRTFLAGLKASF